MEMAVTHMQEASDYVRVQETFFDDMLLLYVATFGLCVPARIRKDSVCLCVCRESNREHVKHDREHHGQYMAVSTYTHPHDETRAGE